VIASHLQVTTVRYKSEPWAGTVLGVKILQAGIHASCTALQAAPAAGIVELWALQPVSCCSNWASVPAALACCPTEVDACAANPCQNGGTGGAANCTDSPYPAPDSAAGRTCSCAKPNSVYTGDATGCVDVNACTSFPCNQGGAGGAASCTDIDAAANNAAGRTCACANGGVYDDATGCAVVGERTCSACL
jgi:hypothetical protein